MIVFCASNGCRKKCEREERDPEDVIISGEAVAVGDKLLKWARVLAGRATTGEPFDHDGWKDIRTSNETTVTAVGSDDFRTRGDRWSRHGYVYRVARCLDYFRCRSCGIIWLVNGQKCTVYAHTDRECQTPAVQATHEMPNPITGENDSMTYADTDGRTVPQFSEATLAGSIDLVLERLAKELEAQDVHEGQAVDAVSSVTLLFRQQIGARSPDVLLFQSMHALAEAARDLGYRAGHNDRNRAIVRRLRGKS